MIANDYLIKKIKNNKILKKEMLKYNAIQVEMYLLYAVSVVLMFIGFTFTMINNMKILGLVMMVLVPIINLLIIVFRNKIMYVSKCNVKYISDDVNNWYYIAILEEVNERHTDIFKYEKFDNLGRKKMVGFSGIVFDKICKNKNKLSGKQRSDFLEKIRKGDEEAIKNSDLFLNNTSILKGDKVIAFKTLSGYCYFVKDNEI